MDSCDSSGRSMNGDVYNELCHKQLSMRVH